jgi:DNA-directed RNA polymerase subunit M/transcription elongation factor TFIIS
MIAKPCPACGNLIWLPSAIDNQLTDCPTCLTRLVIVGGALVIDAATEPSKEHIKEITS